MWQPKALFKNCLENANWKNPLDHWLAIKWKMHSILTSFCLVVLVREQEILRALLVCYTKPTTEPLACGFEQEIPKLAFLVLSSSSSGFVKEPHVSPSPYRWKWIRKGWNDLPKNIYRLLTGPGIEPRVQESLSKAFSTVSHYCFQKHKTFAYYF